MIITISGKAGSGKGTIARGLVEKLWYRHISIWDMKRELATQMGMNIIEFNKLGELPENVERFDKQYEEFQKGLDVHDNIILDSRLSFSCQPKAFKVFLTISDEEAARRIFNDKERIWDSYPDLEAVLDDMKKRNEQDVERYKALYGIDIMDMSQFDLVVDTTVSRPEYYIDFIAEKFQEFQKSRS